MSSKDDQNNAENSDGNFEETVSTARAELETINEHASEQRQFTNKIGFAGADKLNGNAEWLKQEQLLQSAKIDGKFREGIYRNLQENHPQRKRIVKKSLFGNTFTPSVDQSVIIPTLQYKVLYIY